MIKTYIKVVCLLLAVCASFSAKAQIGYHYDQFDAGVALYANKVYGDAETINTTFSPAVTFSYNKTPFLNYVLELQKGTLTGGDSINDISGRQFKNKFMALSGRVQVQAGQFIDYYDSEFKDFLKNIYVGVGIGVVANKLNPVSRTTPAVQGFYTPGKNSGSEMFIPLRIGYDFKIFNVYNEPSIKIDIAYQHNLMMGENLDGYEAGASNDAWSQLTIGIKFGIGGNTSYRKPISAD